MSSEDKRQFTRVSFVTQVKLNQGQQLWLGHVIDISLKGILITSRSPLVFDKAQTITAEISFDNESSMRIKVEEVHHHDEFYGFRFVDYDLEAISHLKKIIMFNSGSESVCERELMTLFNYPK